MITRRQPGGQQAGWHNRGYQPVWVEDGFVATLPTASGQVRSMCQLGATDSEPYDSSGIIRHSAIGSEEWWYFEMQTIGWQPLTYGGRAKGPGAGTSGGCLYAQCQAYPDKGESYASPRLAIYEVYDPKYAQKINGVLHTPSAQNPYLMLWLRGERSSWTRLIAPMRDYADKKMRWVWHVKWGFEGDSFTEVWLNDKQVVFATGDPDGLNTRGVPNCNDDAKGPFYSCGIYVWDLDDQANRDACDVDTLRTWYGELRIGDANSSYAEITGQQMVDEALVAARWHSEEATREVEALQVYVDEMLAELSARLGAIRKRLVEEVTPYLRGKEGL